MLKNGISTLIFWIISSAPYHVEPLPEKNRDHALTGDWIGHRECHIQPDWLLIYRIEDNVLVLTLARTGSHSDLFNK